MFCPKCGAVVEEKDIHCIACGVNLSEVMRAAAEKEQDQPAFEQPSDGRDSAEQPEGQQEPQPESNAWQRQAPPENSPWQQTPPENSPWQQQQGSNPWQAQGPGPGDPWQNPGGEGPAPIRSFFGLNIGFSIASLFCCLNFVAMPLFIIGAVMGKQAENFQARLMYHEARDKARTAKILFWIGVAVFSVWLIYLLLATVVSVFTYGGMNGLYNYFNYYY